MSEYHKIETLYERDEKTFRLKPELIFKNPVYGTIKTWLWTEKVDGTNIRCIWRDGKLTFGGKTDNAQIHAELIKWLYENVSAAKMAEIFPQSNVVIYGEGFGAGIQKGGGMYSPAKKMIMFDVFVEDLVNTKLGGWWLSDENMRDVASKLELDAVPLFGEIPIAEATEAVRAGFKSKCSVAIHDAEGLVGRPLEALYDKKGSRLIVKLKTKDF